MQCTALSRDPRLPAKFKGHLTEKSISQTDGDRLGLDVVVQCSLSELATDTALFEAAEGQLFFTLAMLLRGQGIVQLTWWWRVLYVLTQTVPARRALLTSMAVLRFVVWTAARTMLARAIESDQ